MRGFAAIPLSVGLPQWEAPGVARSYAALPMLTLGLGLPLAASVARGRRKLGLFMACLLIPLGTLLVLTPLLYIAGLVMAWVGHHLGPENAADVARHTADFEKIDGDLHAGPLAAYVAFPGGAVLGSVAVLVTFTRRRLTTEPTG